MATKLPEITLIGSKIKVKDSKNKTLIGLQGKVIDETKNTITIEHNNKVKKLIRSQVKIEKIK
ncbi:hypothetical protein CL617_04275 [archaeon]|nr:hypothetical protein [archaeon]|tara:strand:+ start:291 stop:479 length:189 start_codon:yes stop_codon:yes gene_type:complete